MTFLLAHRNRNLKISKAQLKSQAHQGTSLFTSAQQLHSFTHLCSLYICLALCRAFIYILKWLRQGVLNGVAPECVTNAEFTSTFAKSLCRPAILPVPGFAIRLLFGDERADAILQGQHVVPKRTLESGYKYLYPDPRSACKNLVKK